MPEQDGHLEARPRRRCGSAPRARSHPRAPPTLPAARSWCARRWPETLPRATARGAPAAVPASPPQSPGSGGPRALLPKPPPTNGELTWTWARSSSNRSASVACVKCSSCVPSCTVRRFVALPLHRHRVQLDRAVVVARGAVGRVHPLAGRPQGRLRIGGTTSPKLRPPPQKVNPPPRRGARVSSAFTPIRFMIAHRCAINRSLFQLQ